MHLLISVGDPLEATDAVAGGADIIDIKNPDEGPLGAHAPAVMRAIRDVVPASVPVSATIGDLPDRPGTAALAAFGAAALGMRFVKVGLAASPRVDCASAFLRRVVEAVSIVASPPTVVAVGFGDGPKYGTIGADEIVEAASRGGVGVCMLDTIDKTAGRSLLDVLPAQRLAAFVERAHRAGMRAALAGSLAAADLELVARLGADIVGIRGAACDGGRRNGRIRRERVRELKRLLMPSSPVSPVGPHR
jgi:uncharacterized protein (UPF0264 family)